MFSLRRLRFEPCHYVLGLHNLRSRVAGFAVALFAALAEHVFSKLSEFSRAIKPDVFECFRGSQGTTPRFSRVGMFNIPTLGGIPLRRTSSVREHLSSPSTRWRVCTFFSILPQNRGLPWGRGLFWSRIDQFCPRKGTCPGAEAAVGSQWIRYGFAVGSLWVRCQAVPGRARPFY